MRGLPLFTELPRRGFPETKSVEGDKKKAGAWKPQPVVICLAPLS